MDMTKLFKPWPFLVMDSNSTIELSESLEPLVTVANEVMEDLKLRLPMLIPSLKKYILFNIIF